MSIAFRKPTIASFSPTSGKVGDKITITGSNFNAGTVVKFFNNKTATDQRADHAEHADSHSALRRGERSGPRGKRGRILVEARVHSNSLTD